MQDIVDRGEYAGALDDGYNIDRQQRRVPFVHIRMMFNFEMLYMRHGLISKQVRLNEVQDARMVPYNPYLLVRHRYYDNEIDTDPWKVYTYVYQYCFKQKMEHPSLRYSCHCMMAQRSAT